LSAGPATIVVSGAWLSTQSVGWPHVPASGSQTPAVWHHGGRLQTTGAPPTQLPPWQLSPFVQALPSVQALPFAFVTTEHEPFAGLQLPAR
jgi:hypothetical protein